MARFVRIEQTDITLSYGGIKMVLNKVGSVF